MPDEVRLWEVTGDDLASIDRAKLNLESRLQEWLGRDIAILDPGLLIIGREVNTDFGGHIDILCVDRAGDLVVVELKRDKTPREVTAQALDYAAWVSTLTSDRIASIAAAYLERDLETAFLARFGEELPETLNAEHRVLVVGSEIDAASERIIRYLSDVHGVNINAATFQYFTASDGRELLARVFLIEPAEVELKTRTKGTSRRRSLSFDELRELAVEAGVEDLYDHAVGALEPVLRKGKTLSSIRFVARFDSGRKTILSFLPGESSRRDGLRYQVYRNRFAKLVGRDDVEGLMPAHRDDWVYWEKGGPDWTGYEGFIKSHEEIDRLAGAVRAASADARAR